MEKKMETIGIIGLYGDKFSHGLLAGPLLLGACGVGRR